VDPAPPPFPGRPVPNPGSPLGRWAPYTLLPRFSSPRSGARWAPPHSATLSQTHWGSYSPPDVTGLTSPEGPVADGGSYGHQSCQESPSPGQLVSSGVSFRAGPGAIGSQGLPGGRGYRTAIRPPLPLGLPGCPLLRPSPGVHGPPSHGPARQWIDSTFRPLTPLYPSCNLPSLYRCSFRRGAGSAKHPTPLRAFF
jgi:hypothetical protein